MSGPITPKRIPTDAEYAAFCDAWTEIARADARVTPDLDAIKRAADMRFKIIAVAATRRMRVNGGQINGINRRSKVAKRNQEWLDSGKTAKEIFLDQPKGRGKKRPLTLSQINKVLKARPKKSQINRVLKARTP